MSRYLSKPIIIQRPKVFGLSADFPSGYVLITLTQSPGGPCPQAEEHSTGAPIKRIEFAFELWKHRIKLAACQWESQGTQQGNVEVQGLGIFFFGYAPGPDLACKASVQRAYLRNTVTTTLYSRSVAPGQAYNMAPYWVISKWFIAS